MVSITNICNLHNTNLYIDAINIVLKVFKASFFYSVVSTLCIAQLPLVELLIENRNMSLEKLRPIVRGTCSLECARSVA